MHKFLFVVRTLVLTAAYNYSMKINETPLTGGKTNVGIVQIGDTVRRPLNPNSTFVHKFLK